jgi:hypothetical protein
MTRKNLDLLIPIWTVALGLFFVAATAFAATRLLTIKADAAARHRARLDQNAVEPGKTAVEDQLPPDATPKKVNVGVYMEGISEISILDSKWSPVFYIWFRWTGDELAPGETFRVMDGEITSKEKLVEKVTNGEHYAVYLVHADVTKFFSADRFPLDDHLLTVGLEDSKLGWTQLEFVPDKLNSGISSRVKMPGYQVAQTGMVVKPHAYKTNFGDAEKPAGSREVFSQFVYAIWNVRPGYGTYFKVFVGLYAAALIAILAFFIKPTHVDPRFGLGVGGFFGAVANTLVSASAVPDSGTVTLMDMVNGFGMITIFLTIMQSAIALYLFDTREEVELTARFDRASLIVFACGFALFNAVVPIVGLTSL